MISSMISFMSVRPNRVSVVPDLASQLAKELEDAMAKWNDIV